MTIKAHYDLLVKYGGDISLASSDEMQAAQVFDPMEPAKFVPVLPSSHAAEKHKAHESDRLAQEDHAVQIQCMQFEAVHQYRAAQEAFWRDDGSTELANNQLHLMLIKTYCMSAGFQGNTKAISGLSLLHEVILLASDLIIKDATDRLKCLDTLVDQLKEELGQ